ncbi:hypothetical protein [Alishewanella longhuensis]
MDFLRDGSVHAGMLFYAVFSIGISVVCFLLAKDKGRNPYIAVVLGLIPGLNYLAIAYYIGVSKLGKV